MLTFLSRASRPSLRTSRNLLFSGHLSRQHLPRSGALSNTSLRRPYGTQYNKSSFDHTTEDDEPLELEDTGEYDIVCPKDPYARPVFPPPRHVPSHIARPPYALPASIQLFEDTGHFAEPYSGDGRIVLGSEEERKLRRAAALASRVLKMAGTLAVEGVSTEEIDAKVHDFIIAHGAYPSPLQYSGFPKSCCTSVNNIIVHGIPDARLLRDGDIVNIDITVYLDGYHGDTSKTFLVGDVDDIGRELVSVTEEALEAGIRVCGPGRPFRDIGRAIHQVIKHKDFVVCPGFTGHGIGTVFHRPPWIYHDVNEEPEVMRPGHCFTIEPAIIKGSNNDYMIFGDDWTASTTNWARSAQAEHMVLITESGADVLTRDDSAYT